MAGDSAAFGALPGDGVVEFRVWAPSRSRLEVVVESGRLEGKRGVLEALENGFFAGRVAGLAVGDLYRFCPDGEGPFPDPASRCQPRGVHGPSEIVDPSQFVWSDALWGGCVLRDLVLYEIHVGTFTDGGTFSSARERLPQLRDLGVTAIELMPVADFAGDRNWGYDGVDLFAPARCYGRPDDLRRLVDEAHALGLGVFLDVVYNHFGPDGNYLESFGREFFSSRHRTPWGAAVNLDGANSEAVRDFFFANALHWIREYHMDGLRLDATHALIDEGPRHFLAELAERVRTATAGRALLIAEDHRNLAAMVRPESAGGWGIDAVWADDFHHQVRRHLAGDCEGYYRDFAGTTADVAKTMRDGWFYCGQRSESMDAPRGSDPAGLPASSFVICLQNHDQIGNRAFGERLHHQIDPAAYRAATALLLLAPQTPLLFMGQEWGASSPFLYFTDHHRELGAQVTAGRRREFRQFAAFRDAALRDRIPDPQSVATFEASRLRWGERDTAEHAALLRLYRALLQLRKQLLREATGDGDEFTVTAADDETIAILRGGQSAPRSLVVVRLAGSGTADLSCVPEVLAGRWSAVLSTEEASFVDHPQPPRIDLSAAHPRIAFSRAGAVALRALTNGAD